MKDKNYISKLKQLAENELLSDAVIYRELENIKFEYDITDEKILEIISDCVRVYMRKDYATLIGVAMAAVEYINHLYEQEKNIGDWEYAIFTNEWHGVYDWH